MCDEASASTPPLKVTVTVNVAQEVPAPWVPLKKLLTDYVHAYRPGGPISADFDVGLARRILAILLYVDADEDQKIMRHLNFLHALGTVPFWQECPDWKDPQIGKEQSK